MPATSPAAHLLVLADDPLARIGLRASVLEGQIETADVEIVGDNTLDPAAEASLAFYEPDVLLVDLGWNAEASAGRLADLEPSAPWVALVSESDAAAVAWRAGASAVLPRTVHPAQLVAAVLAVTVGLEVAAPGLGRRRASDADLAGSGQGHELTPRELEVLALLADGLPNKMIARRLGVSDHTVKFHVAAVLSKLGAQSRTEAAIRAARLGLLRL